MDDLMFLCPHCSGIILVNRNQINCHIFRHGIYKSNYQQIDPHMKKEMCEYLEKNNLIYGCGKPFKLVNVNNSYIPQICEYI